MQHKGLSHMKNTLNETGVVICLNTTGNPGFIVEIAVLDSTSGDILLHSLVSPECAISRDATRAHGIHAAMVRNSPTLTEVWPRLVEVTTGQRAIAHDASLHRETLTRHATRDGLEMSAFTLASDQSWSCTLHTQRTSQRSTLTSNIAAQRALAGARSTLALAQRLASTLTSARFTISAESVGMLQELAKHESTTMSAVLDHIVPTTLHELTAISVPTPCVTTIHFIPEIRLSIADAVSISHDITTPSTLSEFVHHAFDRHNPSEALKLTFTSHKKPATVRLTQDHAKQLRKLAKQHECTPSHIVNALCANALKEFH